MKVIKIKNKYKVILDNITLTTYPEVIINNKLLYKKEIDGHLLKKIQEQTEYYNIYYKLVSSINKRLKCENEIKEYLNKTTLNQNDKDKMINKLKETNYINDKRYIQAYISDKIHLTNEGPHKIMKDLINKNISTKLIEEEITKLDNSFTIDKLKNLINKKIKQNKKYSNKLLKQKLLIYFINLGYDQVDIKNILMNTNINDHEQLKKEYTKLDKKYNDKNIIKTKLYQKGYSLENIDKIMKKDSN